MKKLLQSQAFALKVQFNGEIIYKDILSADWRVNMYACLYNTECEVSKDKYLGPLHTQGPINNWYKINIFGVFRIA